jgi:hypothetical protein
MMRKRWVAACAAIVTAGAVATTHRVTWASDHDDGETDLKSRALNLSDHFTFKSGTDLALIMYFNPRSLPGRQYTLSTNARYEFHVSKAASRTSAPTSADDYVFRFEAGAPNPAGVQPVTLTVLQNGTLLGTHSGMSTDFASSKANNNTVNQGMAGAMPVKWFVGMRTDSFHFDVVRFFQVRTFLANRFYGGSNGNGNASATLAPNCRGDAFLGGVLGNTETNPDADGVNLWNPPSCAPDFTKNLNVTSIALNVPIAMLGGGTIFDTWSTISVKQ